MKTAIWVFLGWLGMTLVTAAGVRLSWSNVLPDFTVIALVFLAMRREPSAAAFCALILGYCTGRQALAPPGLHETALVASTIGTYLIVGQIVSSGAWFFAVACGMAVMGYHVLLFVLSYWIQGGAHFSSWATALLIPSGVATFVFAAVAFSPMAWLDSRLMARKREELSWR